MAGNFTFSDAYNGYFSSDLSLYDEFDDNIDTARIKPFHLEFLYLVALLLFASSMIVFCLLYKAVTQKDNAKNNKAVNSSDEKAAPTSLKCKPNKFSLSLPTIQEESEFSSNENITDGIISPSNERGIQTESSTSQSNTTNDLNAKNCTVIQMKNPNLREDTNAVVEFDYNLGSLDTKFVTIGDNSSCSIQDQDRLSSFV